MSTRPAILGRMFRGFPAFEEKRAWIGAYRRYTLETEGLGAMGLGFGWGFQSARTTGRTVAFLPGLGGGRKANWKNGEINRGITLGGSFSAKVRQMGTSTSTSTSTLTASFDWEAIDKEKTHGPHWLDEELRSDHAGETGAVWIYKGAIWAMQLRSNSANALYQLGVDMGCPYRVLEKQEAWQFVNHHIRTEAKHLELMERIVDLDNRSKALPIWKLAAFVLGAMPTLLGPTPKWLYYTVDGVETFVEQHYLNHIIPLEVDGKCPELVRLLRMCMEEEVRHREDAAGLSGIETCTRVPKSFVVRAWFWVLRSGSSLAVSVAKRI
ncbi:hypothetical protein AAMO2058_001537900 [Amorphochlora amoebiformis]